MKQQNKFDEAIKSKIGELEDEPSARVWAAIGSEIQALPSNSNNWIYNVAAAAIVILMIGTGFFMNQSSELGAATTLSAKAKQPRIFVVPLDYQGKSGIYLADKGPVNLNLRPENIPWDEIQQKSVRGSSVNEANNSKLVARPELPNAKQPVFANSETEANLKEKTPEKTNRFAFPDIENEESNPTMALAAAGSKRTFRIPSMEELTVQNVRKKSGAILGAVTEKANELFGLNTSYVETKTEDAYQHTFSADFGIFKIKKVKTITQK